MAARDALAKSLRAAGDREGAAAVKALRRPSVAAWYVNIAARASLVSLREWLALGASLRAAQASPDMDRVRSLASGRAALENRVVRDLTAHLQALGVAVSAPAIDEVRATLRAALADAAASDLVASGRLERALSYGGFGEVDVSAALASWAAAVSKDAAAESKDAAATSHDVDHERSHSAAPGAAEREQREHDARPGLVAAVEEARGQRDRAEAALAVAQRHLREAKAGVIEAEQGLAVAERTLSEAERALASDA